MGFAGELTTIGLDEVFSNVGLNRLTGVLTVTQRERQACVLFEDGLLRAVDPGPGHALDYVQIIDNADLADPAWLKQAEGRRGRRTLKSLLRARKGFDESGYDAAIQAAVREEVVLLLGLREASFVFEEGRRYDVSFDAEQLGCDIVIDPLEVVEEARRRIEEWGRISEWIDSEFDIFVAVRGAPDDSPKDVERVLDLLDGMHAVREVVRELPYGSFHVMRTITDLAEAGIVLKASDEHLVHLAREAGEEGDVHRAIHHLEVVLDRSPEDLPVRRLLVEQQQRAGRKQEAAFSWNRIAQLQEERGDLDGALESYVKAAQLMPHDTDTVTRMFELHLTRGDRRKVLEAGTELARRLMREHSYPEAISVLRRMLEVDDTNRTFREAIATAHLKSHEHDAARDVFLELARETWTAGAFEESLRFYRNVLAIDHGHPEAQRHVREIESGQARRRRRSRMRRSFSALGALLLTLATWQIGREWLAHEALDSAARASLTALAGKPSDLAISASVGRYVSVMADHPWTAGGQKAEETAWTLLLVGLERARARIEGDPMEAARDLDRLGRIPYPEGMRELWELARAELTEEIQAALAQRGERPVTAGGS